jgi:thiol-disulfide isomerase/thioredoxin
MRIAGLSRHCISWMLCTIAVALVTAQPHKSYRGHLNRHLQIDPEALSIVVWDEAMPNDAAKLGISLKSGDRFFTGKLTLGGNSLYAFDGAILRAIDGTDVLYVDTNKDGRFSGSERFVLQSFDGNATDKRLKNHTRLILPLALNSYESCEMEVRLPKADVPTPAGPKQIAVLFTGDAFVEGQVQLPNRKLLIRFQYDFKMHGVDLGQAIEWADVNNDDKIDTSDGSPEMLKARGKPPLFRIGDLVLSAKSVDLATSTFVLRSVPRAEYHRIDLVVGSTVPNFTYIDFEGKHHAFSEIKARYVLLDFWATWCRPCIADLPNQKAVYEEFHGRGFEILGMNGDDSPEKVRKLFDEKKITWLQAARDKALIEDKFQISQWPTLVLIDANRKIISMGSAQHLPLDGENLRMTLQALLPDHR